MRLGVLFALLPVALLSLACGDDDGEPAHEWIATAKVLDKQVERNPSGEWVSLDLEITVLDEETAAFSVGSTRYLLTLRSGSEPPLYDVSIEGTELSGSSREARFRLSIRPLDASQSGYDVIVLADCYEALESRCRLAGQCA